MRKRIGLREVRALGPAEIAWDLVVTGYGVRRQKGEAITYFVYYRTEDGRQRWQTIGRHGSPWTPETARAEARRILGEVVRGADPAGAKRDRRTAKTVAELCEAYLADAEAGRLLTRRGHSKQPSTLATDRGRIARHIKPLLGRMTVAAVTRDDIESFMHAVAEGETAGRIKTGRHGLARVDGGKGTATRTVGLFGAIFAYAVRHRMRLDNPSHGIMRFADGRRERRLSDVEYTALGDALREAEAQGKIWPAAIAMVRFLALTGWRSGEAQALRWSEIDFTRRTARLADTKTGLSVRPLSYAACDVLRTMPRHSADRVFPATRGEGPMVGFKKFWPKIAKLRELAADVARAPAFVRLARGRPGLFRADDRRAHRTQGAFDHVAIRPQRRCGAARR